MPDLNGTCAKQARESGRYVSKFRQVSPFYNNLQHLTEPEGRVTAARAQEWDAEYPGRYGPGRSALPKNEAGG